MRFGNGYAWPRLASQSIDQPGSVRVTQVTFFVLESVRNLLLADPSEGGDSLQTKGCVRFQTQMQEKVAPLFNSNV